MNGKVISMSAEPLRPLSPIEDIYAGIIREANIFIAEERGI
jgi:hypothetical protein